MSNFKKQNAYPLLTPPNGLLNPPPELSISSLTIIVSLLVVNDGGGAIAAPPENWQLCTKVRNEDNGKSYLYVFLCLFSIDPRPPLHRCDRTVLSFP
jgi:hypothetical protein